MADDPFAGCNDKDARILDAADHTISPLPFVTSMPGGQVSLPAMFFATSLFCLASGPVHILLQLQRHRLMLHEAFTPEGARLLAAELVKMADAAESEMLEASNVQLAATLAKGKGA
ncbi:hypothetical protein [Novosphingobium sp.]|uniref:hypothetical protein n=1 Tax=Novosphingobium sp. TaxID=1874826 RepID=UPI00260DF4BC|nr:hypothetical protein [Novosphingobium sp.]